MSFTIKKNEQISKLWKTQEKETLFGKGCNPFVTSIVILLGCEIHKRNMQIKNFDDFHKELYRKRVQETLTRDLLVRKLTSVRISQMIWATYFINAKLIEVGRLQFENCVDFVKIHIPAGPKLEEQKVLQSLRQSKQEIEKYFDMKNPEYRCESWLLSRQMNKLIDANSNIAKFYRLFDVEDGPDATRDILNFVFLKQECEDYSTLQEDTSLQKLLKKQLLSNYVLKLGLG